MNMPALQSGLERDYAMVWATGIIVYFNYNNKACTECSKNSS